MNWLKETIDEFKIKDEQRNSEIAEKKKIEETQKQSRKEESKKLLLAIKSEFEKVKSFLEIENFPSLIEVNGKEESEINSDDISRVSLSCHTKSPHGNNPFRSYDGSSITFGVDYKFENYEITIKYKGSEATPAKCTKPVKILTTEYIQNEIKRFIKQIFK